MITENYSLLVEVALNTDINGIGSFFFLVAGL